VALSACGLPGRVAASVANKIDSPWRRRSDGPQCRRLGASFFDAMIGEEPPIPSLPRWHVLFKAVRSGWKPKRVAVSRDLGITPVDPEVATSS
jgi:amidase